MKQPNDELASLADLETQREAAGLAEYDHASWYGMLAPPRLPEAIRDRLSAAVMRAMATPALRQRLEEMSAADSALPAAGFAALMARDDAMWNRAAEQGLLKAG